MDKINIKICWGGLNLDTGKWYYNPLLEMTEEEQRQSNIENGFLEKDGQIKRHGDRYE